MEHPIRSRQRALSEIDQERYITEEREKRVSPFWAVLDGNSNESHTA